MSLSYTQSGPLRPVVVRQLLDAHKLHYHAERFNIDGNDVYNVCRILTWRRVHSFEVTGYGRGRSRRVVQASEQG
jgi:hypothetical protein